MMLNVDENIMFFGFLEQLLMMLQQLYSRFCDEHMNAAFDSVQRNGIVSSIRSENRDYLASALLTIGLHLEKTYLHCLWGGRLSQSCKILDLFFLPLEIPRTKHPVRYTPLRCSFAGVRLAGVSNLNSIKRALRNLRIAGNFPPETPTMERFPTLPRLRRSNSVKPTTPTFLSDFEAPPPTNPVVYSPVPTCSLISLN